MEQNKNIYKQLIVTADDYGVFPAVNAGILDAVKAGKVNSVSVLPNYPGEPKKNYKSSVENLIRLKTEAENANLNIDLGCHLTITSGKPLSGDKLDFACTEDGYFFDFTELHNFKKQGQIDLLEEELHLQIDALEEKTNIKMKHLTNHHNSLTFLPHLFDVYMRVARQRNLPMRSVRLQPENEQNSFIHYIRRKLRDDMVREDRDQILEFAGEIVDYFSKKNEGVKAPDALDTTHYGPIPQYWPWLISLVRPFNVWNKNRQLRNILEEFRESNDNSIEILLHLGKREGLFIDRSEDLDYPGVTRSYFDSRFSEYKSIMNFDFSRHDGVKHQSWSELK